MKKNYLAFAICALTVQGIAQPVLTAAGINMTNGDVHQIEYCNNMPEGPAGAGQTWNFAAMTSSSTSHFTVGPVSLAPAGSSFGSATHQMNDGSMYNFWNVSSTAIEIVGMDSPSATFIYSDSEEFLHFPFSFNNTFTDSWAVQYVASGITFNRTGTTTVTYDAYGSITTPAGTFNNVARVSFLQNYKDVSSAMTFTTTNNQYFWYLNGNHYPIASVFTITTFGGTSSGGFYSGNVVVTGISGEDVVSSAKIFPNPATDHAVVALASGELLSRVDLYDLAGHQVLAIDEIGESVADIDVHGLSQGIYLLKLTGASGTETTTKLSILH